MSIVTRRRRTPKPGALKPGARGYLCLRANTEDHGLIEHEGDYRYVGVVDGHHAFAPATDEPVVYLTEREVVSFR